MKKDSIIYVVAFTFAVCAIFVLILALANEGTKQLVMANQQFTAQAAVLDALGIQYTDRNQALALYAERVQPVDGATPAAWRASLDGIDYLAVEHSGAGLWGGITIVLAADPAGNRIRGVQIISQNETPGLGGRIEEPWFLDQFRGERAPDGGIRIRVGAESSGSGDTDHENGLADGVTGASRTSQSFEGIINAALKRLRTIAGGAR
jgi:Na+-transporting NADH:ubiquinone oxidoreductase subunit C